MKDWQRVSDGKLTWRLPGDMMWSPRVIEAARRHTTTHRWRHRMLVIAANCLNNASKFARPIIRRIDDTWKWAYLAESVCVFTCNALDVVQWQRSKWTLSKLTLAACNIGGSILEVENIEMISLIQFCSVSMTFMIIDRYANSAFGDG